MRRCLQALAVPLCVAACAFDASGTGAADATSQASTSGSPSTTGIESTMTDASDETTGGGDTEGEGETSTGEPMTTGNACGSTACLENHDLLVRYFLDEGDMPGEPYPVLDSAPDPLHLQLVQSPDGPAYVHEGNWGLEWTKAEGDGVATQPVAGTKLEKLDGATQATIEVVARVHAVTSWYSRFVHFGTGGEGGRFSLAATALSTVAFRWQGETTYAWAVDDLSARDRVVLHLVLDTAAEEPDRLVLYVDGDPIAHPGWSVSQVPITLERDSEFALGNRANGGRSFEGILYYAAIYERALSPAAIAEHAQILREHADRPPA